MGLFDSAAGALFGSADPSTAKVNNADIFSQVFLIPTAMQAFQAAVSLGISPSELFGDAFISDKKALKKGQKSSPGTIFSIGKNQGIDLDKLAPKLPEIFQKVQAKGLETFQSTFEKLGKVPALAPILQQAMGMTSPLSDKQQKSIPQLAEYALGAAAKGNLLNNPLVVAKALAPLAFQTANLEYGQQQAKLAQALGLAGAPGLAGVNPLFQQAVPSAQSYVPSVLQSAQLSGQLSQYNSQAGLQAQMFNVQQGADLFGTFLGFASGGGGGGGGGGGAGGAGVGKFPFPIF